MLGSNRLVALDGGWLALTDRVLVEREVSDHVIA